MNQKNKLITIIASVLIIVLTFLTIFFGLKKPKKDEPSTSDQIQFKREIKQLEEQFNQLKQGFNSNLKKLDQIDFSSYLQEQQKQLNEEKIKLEEEVKKINVTINSNSCQDKKSLTQQKDCWQKLNQNISDFIEKFNFFEQLLKNNSINNSSNITKTIIEPSSGDTNEKFQSIKKETELVIKNYLNELLSLPQFKQLSSQNIELLVLELGKLVVPTLQIIVALQNYLDYHNKTIIPHFQSGYWEISKEMENHDKELKKEVRSAYLALSDDIKDEMPIKKEEFLTYIFNVKYYFYNSIFCQNKIIDKENGIYERSCFFENTRIKDAINFLEKKFEEDKNNLDQLKEIKLLGETKFKKIDDFLFSEVVKKYQNIASFLNYSNSGFYRNYYNEKFRNNSNFTNINEIYGKDCNNCNKSDYDLPNLSYLLKYFDSKNNKFYSFKDLSENQDDKYKHLFKNMEKIYYNAEKGLLKKKYGNLYYLYSKFISRTKGKKYYQNKFLKEFRFHKFMEKIGNCFFIGEVNCSFLDLNKHSIVKVDEKDFFDVLKDEYQKEFINISFEIEKFFSDFFNKYQNSKYTVNVCLDKLQSFSESISIILSLCAVAINVKKNVIKNLKYVFVYTSLIFLGFLTNNRKAEIEFPRFQIIDLDNSDNFQDANFSVIEKEYDLFDDFLIEIEHKQKQSCTSCTITTTAGRILDFVTFGKIDFLKGYYFNLMIIPTIFTIVASLQFLNLI